MTLVEIGNLKACRPTDTGLPQTGIVIEATREEVARAALLLYKPVRLIGEEEALQRDAELVSGETPLTVAVELYHALNAKFGSKRKFTIMDVDDVFTAVVRDWNKREVRSED